MTHLYSARGSFHPLRPKNTIKLPTESAEKWICMGKKAVLIWGEFIFGDSCTDLDRSSAPNASASNPFGLLGFIENALQPVATCLLNRTDQQNLDLNQAG